MAACRAIGQLLGEEKVSQLGLAVGEPRTILPSVLEVQVLHVHVAQRMCRAGEKHDASLARGVASHEGQQQSREIEVAEVVDADLLLEACVSEL
eukprot:scaffold1490_cov162-Ochromonas_danica.AAC.5